jgi:hypothetical protein
MNLYEQTNLKVSKQENKPKSKPNQRIKVKKGYKQNEFKKQKSQRFYPQILQGQNQKTCSK